MDWDFEVDVVCTGDGIGGLATAIVAADDGLDVLVVRSCVAALNGGYAVAAPAHPWMVDVVDSDTNDYFASLSAGMAPQSWAGCRGDVPVRVVQSMAVVESRRIEPFYGAKLKDWAASCLASPYGFLSTRISGRCPTTKMKTSGGETIEVAVIGSLETGAGVIDSAGLVDWLLGQVSERPIDMMDAAALQRIVFEDGEPVGAVFATPDGPCAVRARRMLMVAPTGGPDTARPVIALDEHESVRVCLVMQSASRFGRVELLATAPETAPVRPTCAAVNRKLLDSLHDTRQNSAQPRCRKAHRYPPVGQ